MFGQNWMKTYASKVCFLMQGFVNGQRMKMQFIIKHDFSNMKSENKILRVDSILEYYDHPQLLTARDSFDTLYLCLLYDDFSTCQYTAIRISAKRLNDFISGKLDLRNMFLMPENEQEYFDIEFDNNQYILSNSSFKEIPEERLPHQNHKR